MKVSEAAKRSICKHSKSPALTGPVPRQSMNVTEGTMMSTDLKIDYIELPASDFDAVQAFYESVFGWTFQDYGEGYRAFSDGKLDGGFYQSGEL